MQLVIICRIIPIAQVSPRGGAASGDPPHPPSFFEQKFTNSKHECMNK